MCWMFGKIDVLTRPKCWPVLMFLVFLRNCDLELYVFGIKLCSTFEGEAQFSHLSIRQPPPITARLPPRTLLTLTLQERIHQ